MTLRTDFTSGELAEAIAASRHWADLIRRLGLRSTAGLRKQLQKLTSEYGIDTRHFTRQSPWRRYTDEAIADAVARSRSLREVALALGAVPASGTLSHLGRRIRALGLRQDHFVRAPHTVPELDLPREQIAEAAALSRSTREVMRTLGLDEHLNHRKVRPEIQRLGLDTGHFRRRSTDLPPQAPRRPGADVVLSVLAPGSTRTDHRRLRRALDEKNVPYSCRNCGNPGVWCGTSMTLQIDHINGDWHDNRLENLRYLCPNCHAITETWCGRGRRAAAETGASPPATGRAHGQ